jgi:uncharacterized lipoprotein YmbA
MRGRVRRIAVVLLGAIVIASGAAGCGGRSAETRFYVLAPMPGATAPVADGRPVTIGVGPVRLPGYVDRGPIVTRRGAEQIDLGELDRWGEPLADAVPRILTENLATLMPAERFAQFPWLGSRQIQYQVVVDITRFDGPLGGAVVLESRWRIIGPERKDLGERRFATSEPAAAATYPAQVAAMSRAIAALSRDIASGLAAR